MGTELGEDLRAFTAESKAKRHKKQEAELVKIQDWCYNHSISFEKIADHHFRMKNFTIIIDIYPQHNKYHRVDKNKRGTYRNVIELLEKHLL